MLSFCVFCGRSGGPRSIRIPALEVTPVLMVCLSAIEGPEEKVKFEKLYCRYRGYMLKIAARVLRGSKTRRTRCKTPS